jgi:RNA polymerase sigma-70 factor (ECF subfamily)
MTVTVDELVWIDDFESIFRAEYGRLVRALTVVAGNSETAADAVQEAFVKAHVRWRRVSRYEDPVGWIRRVAINNLRDEHRRFGRKRKALDRLAAEPLDLPTEPAINEISSLLDGLPRQQRLCLALYYVEGLTVAETAAALDLSDGAVKFHLHQGRKRLRGELEDERS